MRDEIANVVAVIGSIVAVILSVAAIAIALVVLEKQIGDIQNGREASAGDTCVLFHELVNLSPKGSKQRAKGNAVLGKVGLGDCKSYSLKVRNGTLRKVRQ